MPVRAPSNSGIQMRVRAVAQGKLVSPLGAHGNFDTLDGVQYQQTQFAIEDVQVQHIFEAGSGLEGVRCVISLERQPVGAEAVVIQMPQIKLRLSGVCDRHASRLQLRNLLRKRECRFGEGTLGHGY